MKRSPEISPKARTEGSWNGEWEEENVWGCRRWGDNRRIGGFGKFWLSQGPKNNAHFSLSLPLSLVLLPMPDSGGFYNLTLCVLLLFLKKIQLKYDASILEVSIHFINLMRTKM
jgi:hypothetical protein